MKNLGQMMKQAQQMQAKMAEMQEALDAMEVEGSAGAGMVTVKLNGKGDMKAIKIDPQLLDGEEADVVEDLIIAAHTDARAKVQEATAEEMRKITGGLDLPKGMTLPF